MIFKFVARSMSGARTLVRLRTIMMKDDMVYLQGGAGIVADSDPMTEYQETLNKLKALERAISIAEGANS